VRLTARTRLTLLYTAVLAAAGGTLVAVTYLLLSHSLSNTATPPPTKISAETANLIAKCTKMKESGGMVSPDIAARCADAFQLGVRTGAAAQSDAVLHDLLVFSLATLAAVVVLATAGGWLLAGRILRPLHQITATARAAGRDDLGRRVALQGPRDELRELADTFDAMLDRLQAAFASQSRFIANAGHELRTPLATLRTTVDVVLAKSEPTEAELIAMAVDVRQAADGAAALVDALLTLARTERGLTERETVDLADLTDAVLASVRASGLNIEVTAAPAPVLGNPVLLRRMIANLVDNATRYNVPGGRVVVETGSDGEVALLRVSNTGPSIPPNRVEDLFEPFTRLEQRTGSGLGLGLALVRSITTQHGGTVRAQARPDGGLCLEMRLPAAADVAAEEVPVLTSQPLAARADHGITSTTDSALPP
jgi:signal transduction histidine kinase